MFFAVAGSLIGKNAATDNDCSTVFPLVVREEFAHRKFAVFDTSPTTTPPESLSNSIA
jgi:hypothetical protein